MSSIAMQMTKKMMKEQYALQGTNRPDGSFDPMKMREASDASMLMLPPEQGVVFEPVQLGIMPGEKCTPEKHSDEAVIFYIQRHGLHRLYRVLPSGAGAQVSFHAGRLRQRL